MSNINSFQLEQNESYAVIDWKAEQLGAANSEELENAVRLLFKKDYANIILNLTKLFLKGMWAGILCIVV